MTARVDHAVTSGTFSLDGQTFDVDNNVWVIGDDRECVVLDAPHDVAAILALVGDRQVRAILATHAHDDHVRVAPELAEATGAPVLLHAADRVLWDMVHPHLPPDGELHDGQSIEVGGTDAAGAAHPRAQPRGVQLPRAGAGRGVHRRHALRGWPGRDRAARYSDFDTIVRSIRTRLLTLPPETVVHTGHGDDTTIGAEAPHLQEWLDRGH